MPKVVAHLTLLRYEVGAAAKGDENKTEKVFPQSRMTERPSARNQYHEDPRLIPGMFTGYLDNLRPPSLSASRAIYPVGSEAQIVR